MNICNRKKELIGLPAKRFVLGVAGMILNLGLTYFLVVVVWDGSVTYKQAFFISIPVIILLAIHFAKSVYWFYLKEQHFNFLDLVRFVMLIFSILLLVFNICVWLPLLD